MQFEAKSETRGRWWLLVAALLIVAAVVLLRPAWAAAVWRALDGESIAGLAAYLRSFGPLTPMISILLMVLQSIVAPLPASLIAGANGAIFGIWWGTLLSWAGGLAGATTAFWLARWLGHDAVARRVGQGPLQQVERFGGAHGFWLVLIARLIPLISFDLVSYLAGLSRIGFARFMLATAIGMAPGTFAYTVFGHDLVYARAYTWRLSLLGLVGVIAYVAGYWWLRRTKG